MRIVDRETFMSLPAGTIYAKIPEPIIVGDLSVKGDSIGSPPIDFATLSIANWQSNDSGDWAERFYQMSEGNVSVPCDDMFGRDGMFDKEDKFLVLEHADLLILRKQIDDALALPDLPTAAKVFERIP